MEAYKEILKPSAWGLTVGENNELLIYSFRLTDFAESYGTPLYILDKSRLEYRANAFKTSAARNYRGKVSVHYPFKCNSVPAVVSTIKSSGLKAEVMTDFELKLALRCGYTGSDIVVNGPCKTDIFLKECMDKDVRLISVDSLDELKAISAISVTLSKKVDVLLRLNPDYIPKGLPSGSATGSKKSVFGLNVKRTEINFALNLIVENKNLSFAGFHFHIGTGIANPEDYEHVIKKLSPLFQYFVNKGLDIKIIDVGGGYPSSGTRELKTYELILSQIFKRYQYKPSFNQFSFDDFTERIGKTILSIPCLHQPELIYEPGRSIVSSCQHLLLKVQRTKGKSPYKWLITDGGLGTITLPTYYEYHKIFLTNNVCRPGSEFVTITGPCCFAGDIVYKNIKMPEVNQGEVLAVMDTGAYFNGFESNFGFARPGIVMVSKGSHKLIRKRESYDDMTLRDTAVINNIHTEVKNEV